MKHGQLSLVCARTTTHSGPVVHIFWEVCGVLNMDQIDNTQELVGEQKADTFPLKLLTAVSTRNPLRILVDEVPNFSVRLARSPEECVNHATVPLGRPADHLRSNDSGLLLPERDAQHGLKFEWLFWDQVQQHCGGPTRYEILGSSSSCRIPIRGLVTIGLVLL
jgi:hypothetical protein